MAIRPIEVEYILKDGISAQAKQAGKSIKTLGTDAKEAGKAIKAGMSEAQGNIRQMTKDIKQMEQQMRKIPAGSRKAELEADLSAARKALGEERVRLDALRESYDKTSQSVRSLTREQRELVQEMAKLKIAGQDASEEYQEMAKRAAEITDALGDVRQETNALAHDNSGFAGVTSGLQGLVGGFTAVTGVMGLFAGESEELQRIQTRLQAVMAITLGVQQALDAINRSSAFSTVVLAKANTLLTVANTRLAVAFGISTASAKLLMSTLTLGLSAAITAAIVWYNKYVDAQEEARRTLEERIEAEKEGRAQSLKARVELEETIKSIERFKGSKDEEKRKVEELNQTYGSTFGYYENLSQWYDVLKGKLEAYVHVLFLQAKAQSLINKAVEADAKVAKIEATPEEAYASWTDKFNIKDAGYNIPLLKKNRELKAAQEVKKGILDEVEALYEEIEQVSKKHHLGGLGGNPDHQDPEAEQRKRETEKRKAEEVQRKHKQRQQLIDETAKALAASTSRGEAYIASVGIEKMKEGRDKERAQVELEWKEERERIKQIGRERLDLIAKLREHGAKVPEGQEMSVKVLMEAELAANTDLKAARLKAIDDEEAKQWQEYLGKFRDFAAKRKAVEQEYARDVAKLRAGQTQGNQAEVQAAIEEAGRLRKQALQMIDREEADATEEVTSTLARLYEDAAEKSSAEIKRIIAGTEALIEYLKTTPAEALQARNGISAAKLRTIKDDPQGIKELEQGVKSLKREIGSRSPFEGLFDAWKEGVAEIKKGGKESIGKGIAQIGTAVTEVTPHLKQLGQSLGDLFGDNELSDNISVLADTLAGLGSAAAGVGQIMSGDILGGAQNIIKGIASIISMASKAEQAHREALKQVHSAQLEYERQYQLALLRTRLLAEQATTPFGTDQIVKAREALKVYADAQRQLREQLKGDDPRNQASYMLYGWTGLFDKQIEAYRKGIGLLSQTSVVTGHRKTGLFGWGKGEDVYSSLLDVYPKLIDANGELDTVMLKQILSTRKMREEDKKRLEGLLETTEVAKEASKAFDDYLSSTFGSLGSSMTDALLTSIKEGGDAMQLFAQDVGQILEGLLKQSIFASFFKEQFENYRQKLKKTYETADPVNLVSEVTKLSKGLIDNLKQILPSAKAATEAGVQAIREAGLSSDQASQQAKSGAFSALTQEQGTKLEGLFTSGQMHWASIDDQMRSVTADLSGVLDGLNQIITNTAPISGILQELQLMRRDGVTIK